MPPAVSANAAAMAIRRPGVTDHVAADMRAQADDDGHRQEREPGLQRAGAEHVLQVDRGEQERAEQDRGRGQHHHEPAADPALAEPRDVEQGRAGVQLQGGERGEAGEAGEAEAERLQPRSSRRRRPARGRRPARPGSRSRPARRGGRGRATAGGRRRRARPSSAATATPIPTGRLMRKMARQSTSSVSVPPSSTPMAAPAPPTAPHTPSAFARSGPWKVVVMIDSAAGDSIAAPRPWPARAAKKTAVARRQRRDERGDGEHAEPGEEDATTPEQVRGASAEQQQAAEDERVARDRPAEVAAADARGRWRGPAARRSRPRCRG